MSLGSTRTAVWRLLSRDEDIIHPLRAMLPCRSVRRVRRLIPRSLPRGEDVHKPVPRCAAIARFDAYGECLGDQCHLQARAVPSSSSSSSSPPPPPFFPFRLVLSLSVLRLPSSSSSSSSSRFGSARSPPRAAAALATPAPRRGSVAKRTTTMGVGGKVVGTVNQGVLKRRGRMDRAFGVSLSPSVPNDTTANGVCCACGGVWSSSL